MNANNRVEAILIDANGNELGTLTIAERKPGYLAGNFAPLESFATVKSVFDDFEEAVEGFSLSVVDGLETKIRNMGIRLKWSDDSMPIPVNDLQIFPGEGVFSCRPRVPVEGNGTAHQSMPLAAN